MVALNVYRASNVWVDLCNSSCLVHQLQSTKVSLTVTSSNECSWTVSANVNEGTHNHDSRTQSIQFTRNSIIHCLYTINSSTLDVGIIASVFSLPSLNPKFALRPSGNNIHDTFPTGTVQDTTFDCHTHSSLTGKTELLLVAFRGFQTSYNAKCTV